MRRDEGELDHRRRPQPAVEMVVQQRLGGEGDLFGEWRAGSEVAAPTSVLAPVMPSKIVCIGLNYKDHAAEQGKPVEGSSEFEHESRSMASLFMPCESTLTSRMMRRSQ